MTSSSILGQILEAAAKGGGLRSAPASSGGQTGGGLGDLLGQVLGSQGGSQGASGGAGGGLQEILEGMLGGRGSPAGPAGGAPETGAASGRSIEDILGGILGGGANPRTQSGAGSNPASDILRDFGARMGSSPAPAPISVPNSPVSPEAAPRAPSSAPQSGGAQPGGNDLVKYGGIAILGMLAYKALRNWQAGGSWGAAPSGAGFLPGNMPSDGEAFSSVLVKAMIAAMQADGVIDADEQRRLVGQLQQMGADESDRQSIAEQLRERIDLADLVAEAKTPEMGLQIYAASVLAIAVDTPAERAYLDELARRLGIDPGLKAEVERTVNRG